MPNEQVITIRQPATANLMIDSADRDPSYSTAWDFQITKTNSIMNGFFSRIATTEVVLEWCVPNISADAGTNTIVVDISGATGVVTNQTITLPSGFYTVEEALDTLASKLTDLSGTTGSTFSVTQTVDGLVYLGMNSGTFNIATATNLSNALDMAEIASPGINAYLISECADLRLYRYIDFVSSQLTYNQDLKDNSTATFNRDVLCRWYMAWDVEPQYDAYGFPILMGYKKFVVRRLFNPPKYIRWSNNQPLGNIAFQVYDDDGILLTNNSDKNNWLMTLQFSEN